MNIEISKKIEKAEACGSEGTRQVINKIFEEVKTDILKLTTLHNVLYNQKEINEDIGRESFIFLYDEKMDTINEYVFNNFKGDLLDFYLFHTNY